MVELLSKKLLKQDQCMKISARNTIKGTVTKVVPGAVNTEVTIEVGSGAHLVAIITKSSAEGFELAEGKEVYAVIKATDVMVAVE